MNVFFANCLTLYYNHASILAVLIKRDSPKCEGKAVGGGQLYLMDTQLHSTLFYDHYSSLVNLISYQISL